MSIYRTDKIYRWVALFILIFAIVWIISWPESWPWVVLALCGYGLIAYLMRNNP